MFLVVFLNKKANGVIAIIIVLIVIVFLAWFVNISNRECKSNNDCGEDYYCGSDFSCHEYPTIEKTVNKVSFTGPILIIGLVVLLIFFRTNISEFIRENREERRKRREEKLKDKETKEISEKTYSNYPAFSHSDTVKGATTKGRKVTESKKAEYVHEKITEKTYLFQNNYIGMILAGLLAIGIVLVTNVTYMVAAIFGAVLLFFLVYKLWDYCIEYDSELYLIGILSLIYFTFSLIFFVKGGMFILIGLSFLVLLIFIIKETLSWIGYRNL